MSNDQKEVFSGNQNKTPKKVRRNSQQPGLGIGAGIVATIAGIAILILIAQKYKMPMMSIVVAFGIASAIRYAGKAQNVWYGMIGAVLSFIAATAGNIATGINIYCVKYPSMTPKAIITNLNFENALTLIQPVGWPMVIICSLASIGIGFWYSFKHPVKATPNFP